MKFSERSILLPRKEHERVYTAIQFSALLLCLHHQRLFPSQLTRPTKWTSRWKWFWGANPRAFQWWASCPVWPILLARMWKKQIKQDIGSSALISCFLELTIYVYSYFKEDVDSFMKQPGNETADVVLKKLDEQYQKYKFMELNLAQKKRRWVMFTIFFCKGCSKIWAHLCQA